MPRTKAKVIAPPTVYTSCFSRLKFLPPNLQPVAISRWLPRWQSFKGRRELDLAPTATLLKADITIGEFANRYVDQISVLDPQEVYARSQGCALLCFCQPGFFCHRRLLAEHLETALNVVIPEAGFDRDLLAPFAESPCKGDDPLLLPWTVRCDHCHKRNNVPLGATSLRCEHCTKRFPVEW